MTKRTLISTGAIVVAIFFGTAILLGPVTARGISSGGFGGMHGDYSMGPGMHLFKMVEKLDLSVEQRSEVGSLMDETMPQMREFAFGMMDDRKALRELTEGDSYDEARVRQIAERIGDRVTEMVVAGTRTMAEMRALLTEEQREKLASMKGDHEGKRRHRSHH